MENCAKHPKEPVLPGRKSCVNCRDHKREFRRWCIENGKCVNHKAVDAEEGKTICAACTESYKQSRKNNPGRDLKYMYGLTVEARNTLLKAQNNTCAICKKPGKLVVDHCHASGVVRGLLHQSCNKALGFLQDSPELLEAAAAYLRSKVS